MRKGVKMKLYSSRSMYYIVTPTFKQKNGKNPRNNHTSSKRAPGRGDIATNGCIC